MSSNALVIFVRKPEAGKVKTRLAASVGNDKALSIYKELLLHTLNVVMKVDAIKHIYYEGEIDLHDIWDIPGFIKRKQYGVDLGQRMSKAFQDLTPRFKHVVIIGSDCFELNPEIVNDAFNAFTNFEAVIGPAKDGGYYLLGMKAMIQDVFMNKSWSSSEVYQETVSDFTRLKLPYKVLPVLQDVDTVEDLPGYLSEP